MSPPVVRFAPSPTGRIHIGNARTALLNRLFIKKRGCRFVLRFDDTDAARSRKEYIAAIEEDLRSLGVYPDEIVQQSARVSLYDVAVERLRAAGRLYPAYDSADELERRRNRSRAVRHPSTIVPRYEPSRSR
jgi:glutamyl-tRNA synthetase